MPEKPVRIGNGSWLGYGSAILPGADIGEHVVLGANSVVITDVPADATVVGNPGHVVRVDGRKPVGPDADWIHLPDPVADAIKRLSERIESLDARVAELSGDEAEPAPVRPLRAVRGPNPAGG